MPVTTLGMALCPVQEDWPARARRLRRCL